MACIAGEIKPDKEEDWHADSAYRVHLVQACVYKTILKAIGADQLSPELRTAIDRELPREISSGTQASSWQCHKLRLPMLASVIPISGVGAI